MDYLNPYLPLLLMLLVGTAFAAVALGASAWVGPRRPNPAKQLPYECGIEPEVSAKIRVPIKFYRVALLFLLFDMETMLILAWAIAFRDPAIPGFQVYAFFVMIFFVAVLAVGFLYEWSKGALEW